MKFRRYLSFIKLMTIKDNDPSTQQTIKSKDFQEWLMYIKAERIATTNYANT